MQIKKLEMAGFKSFMNPVTLDFGGGITAILGPNGCGKSNVVDAIRWVLGEQSAKQLRGDKMQNVLFGGTRVRKPLGMAQVSVCFTNHDGRLPVAYGEVEITRRLARDGTSDYLLNGSPCRLKDIKDLITDTGAGSHAYSIIEREMVDQVISGHEDSRRFLFEEASGIMKYRMRRREALRKLEMTEQDLLRLSDIIEENAKSVRSLRRQMGRARRYQEIQEKLRKAETFMARRKLVEYREQAAGLETRLEGLRVEDTSDDARGHEIGAQIEVLRAKLVDMEGAHRKAGEVCEEVASELKVKEESILVLGGRLESTRDARTAATDEVSVTDKRLEEVVRDRSGLESERSELEKRLETERQTFQTRKEELALCEAHYEQAREDLVQCKQRSFDFAHDASKRQNELELLRAALSSHETRAQELRAQLRSESERGAHLEQESGDLARRVHEIEVDLEARRAALAETERRAEALGQRLQDAQRVRAEKTSRLEAARSRLELVQGLVDSRDGFGDGARSLLDLHPQDDGLLGTLAQQLDPPRGLEIAFATLLGDVLDALLVRDGETAAHFLRELQDEDRGRATLVVPDTVSETPTLSMQGVCKLPGVIGVASDLLAETGQRLPALSRLLSRAVVVETAQTARAVLEHTNDPALRVATRDGMLWTGAGVVHGGSTNPGESNLLGRTERIEQYKSEMRALETALDQDDDLLRGLESERETCREAREKQTEEYRQLEIRHRDLDLERASRATSRTESASYHTKAQAQLAEVETAIASLETRLPELTLSADRSIGEDDAQSQAVATREKAVAVVEQEREKRRQEVGELRVTYVSLQGELESHARQIDRLGELERELGELRTRRVHEITRADQDSERYTAELVTTRDEAATLAEKLGTVREAQTEELLRLDTQRGAIDTEQARLLEIEKTHREQQAQRHEVEMAHSECRMRRQNLIERMREQYKLGEDELLALEIVWTDDEPLPDEETVRELRDTIGRLGPVNLLALEEHQEKSQRLQFLEEQREDLTRAGTALRETIEKINRTAHFLFMDTFEEVRKHFRETVRTVFDGGDGDLVLENPEDPLETDIEILVRPRGKKIDTLSQLSSGERALTAIALLFSIYLVKPSPFCVFDEVDAPLDDANIGRFVQLLENFKNRTQFIVITHNKLTMAAADRLYGVTMEEQGVSKLVSVALDGEPRGVPQKLRRKVERRVVASAVLTPNLSDHEEVPETASATVGDGGNGGTRHAGASPVGNDDVELESRF